METGNPARGSSLIITYIDHFIIVHRPHPPGTHPQLLSMQENMLML